MNLSPKSLGSQIGSKRDNWTARHISLAMSFFIFIEGAGAEAPHK